MQYENALYQLSFRDQRTWTQAVLFTMGNILLPQLCHTIPQGGLILLPIYFFTLVGAYIYGWRTGLLIAIASPLLNHLLFGMPPAPMLPVLLLKSSVLALIASMVARRFKHVSLVLLLQVVVGYQLVGGLGEALLQNSLTAPLQDWRIGWPGLLLQVVAGYGCIKALVKIQDK
ncbi:MAG: ECF transporter S component [Prevotella sp.]|nr:ECF transporter S component [Prevotella sp.]